MRKFSILLSVLVLATMILAACGGEETSTTIPSTNIVPTTAATETSVAGAATSTEASTATEVPTEANTTSTPGIPVTGGAGADRLSQELDYKVLDQSGKQVGKVEDMVLDLSKAKVLYVVVGTGGFLDIGEKKIAVPWPLLRVGPDSTNSNANKPQNAFVLQTDTDTFKNAPELDPKNVPALGQEPDSWDISMRKYWSGGASSTNNTPSPDGTATSTNNSAGTGTGNATSTPAANGVTNQANGTGQGATTITGVQLASKVIGAKVTVGVPAAAGTSTPGAAGTSTGPATSTPATGSGAATSTPVAATEAATSTPSTSAKNVNAKIDDLIVNNDTDEILYVVIKANLNNGEHLIPVPLSLFKLDVENEVFILDIDAAMLQNAPSFKENEFPDLTLPGWNNEFDSFWQTGASSGSGNNPQATATP